MAMLPWTSFLWLLLLAPKGIVITRRWMERNRKRVR